MSLTIAPRLNLKRFTRAENRVAQPQVAKPLLQKLLAIILIPLIIQVGFLSFYAVLLKKSDQVLQAQRHSGAVIEHLNWLATLVSQKSTFSIQLAVTGDKEFLHLKTRTNTAIESELKALRLLSVSDDNLHASIEMLAKSAVQLADVCDTPMTASSDAKNIAYCPSLKNKLLEFTALHDKILAGEQKQLKLLESRLPEALAKLHWLTFVGVLVNVLCAVFIGLTVGAGIVRRIARLSKKAKLIGNYDVNVLKSRQGDEIDDLIESFNIMEQTLKGAIEKEKSEARTDFLSGLPNRRALIESAEQQISLARRWGVDISFAIIDIDHFKKINDTYGHEVGDEVIKAVGGILKSFARTSDMCSRWGGEEFVVAMPKTDLQGAIAFAERFRSRTKELKVLAGNQLVTVNVSIGVAQLGLDESFSECVKRSDEALYQAKESGRNCVRASHNVKLEII